MSWMQTRQSPYTVVLTMLLHGPPSPWLVSGGLCSKACSSSLVLKLHQATDSQISGPTPRASDSGDPSKV